MDAYLMHVTAFARQRRSLKLFSEPNSIQFASVMGLVMFVVLAFFMTAPTPHGGIGVDVPRVLGPAPLPGANRKDTIKITITRDGHVFIGPDPLYEPGNLQNRIKDLLKDPEVEQTVYIKADARARWGAVKLVLQAVHDAGIVRVAFLANQRHVH